MSDLSQIQEETNEGRGTAAEALCYLERILTLARFDVTASIGRITDEEVILDLEGPDASFLIGRHGQTLDALQYLVLVVVSSRKPAPPDARITIDVEGYRQRRIETLTRYAKSLAAQVRETNEEAVLEPLNPLERRIVHTALMDDPYVQTYSEGYGPDRHIVISPRTSGDAQEDDGEQDD